MVQQTRVTAPRSLATLFWAVSATFSPIAYGQTSSPLAYTLATPRPISPADGTTTPSAQATQRQNPFLGSVPSHNTGQRLELSLKAALERGLRYNLGLIESSQASADVRAERLRALSALLPQISAEGRQLYENISYKEIGLKLPAIPGRASASFDKRRVWISGRARQLHPVTLQRTASQSVPRSQKR